MVGILVEDVQRERRSDDGGSSRAVEHFAIAHLYIHAQRTELPTLIALRGVGCVLRIVIHH